jgi:hypothetical protein
MRRTLALSTIEAGAASLTNSLAWIGVLDNHWGPRPSILMQVPHGRVEQQAPHNRTKGLAFRVSELRGASLWDLIYTDRYGDLSEFAKFKCQGSAATPTLDFLARQTREVPKMNSVPVCLFPCSGGEAGC